MKPLSILFVDDDDDIREIVVLALSLDPAVTLRAMASAREALNMLAAGYRPDVALLDVMMPGMDGPTLLDQLGRLPATANIPVIFMTAKARQADVALYRARGATGVMTKPFDPMTLAADIRAVLADGDRPPGDG